MCLTGSGPGCPDLGPLDSTLSSDVEVVYYYDATAASGVGQLRANASCRRRDHVFLQPLQPPGGADGIWPARSSISVYCVGFVWSEPVPTRCVGWCSTRFHSQRQMRINPDNMPPRLKASPSAPERRGLWARPLFVGDQPLKHNNSSLKRHTRLNVRFRSRFAPLGLSMC